MQFQGCSIHVGTQGNSHMCLPTGHVVLKSLVTHCNDNEKVVAPQQQYMTGHEKGRTSFHAHNIVNFVVEIAIDSGSWRMSTIYLQWFCNHAWASIAFYNLGVI